MRSASLNGLRIGLAAILIAFLGHTRADPDLWGHVLFGREILGSGRIPTADSFSFLSDRPWINHEWLSECVMYAAYAASHGVGLVILKLLLLGAMLTAVVASLRARRVEGTDLDLLLALVLIGVFAQANHVRPQVFSLAMFAWLLTMLNSTGSPRRLLVVPVLMAVWVNLHGGWIVGGGTLALWTGMTLVRRTSAAEKAWLVGTGIAALAATLVNPYGIHMWEFLWETVGFGRADITEWQPVYRVGFAFLSIWLLLAAAATAAIVAAVRGGRLDSRSAAPVIMLGLASFRVNRLTAFFAIAVVMLLGAELAALRRRRQPVRASAAVHPARYAAAVMLLAAAVMVGSGAIISARNVSCVRMDAPGLPEPEVVSVLARMGLEGRLLIWFDWGEYAIWHLGDSMSVSIDGRRETVYSTETLRRHLDFYFVPATRSAFLADARPDYIWLPPHLPVVRALEDDGWQVLFKGPKSVLLARAGSATDAGTARSSRLTTGIADRCFPGP
jgi:hypothetical protein